MAHGRAMHPEPTGNRRGPGQDARELLATTNLFGGLSAADLDDLASRCKRYEVEAGSWCVREHEPGDALYLVISGRLRAYVGDDPRSEIRTGEIFGEVAVLTGHLRTMSVRAVRDTELLALPAADFNRLIEERPAVLRQVAHVVIDRLIAADRGRETPDEVLTIAAVALAADDHLLDEVLAGLTDAFNAYGPAALARREDAPHNGSLSGWAHRLESSNRWVIYRADRSDPHWLRWCLRQADRILLVADASRTPAGLGPDLGGELAAETILSSRELLLVHTSTQQRPRSTAGWLAALGGEANRLAHHHLRRGARSDLARLARLLSGRGCGLVLGGGGPRGFAHLGAMRALDEAGVPIDAVGGTSIGAVMGALRALDLDVASRRREAVAAFVESGFLFSPTLPLLSLSSGRKIRRLLERAVEGALGAMDIEDCWLGYFCVSANLTRAEAVVHEHGSLAAAVRASLTLPGLLPPVLHGRDLLIDGGLLNNLPVDVIRQRLSGGTVVAVDLSVDVEMPAPEAYEDTASGWQLLGRRLRRGHSGEPVPSLLSVLMRAKELASVRAQRELGAAHSPDLHLRPPVEGFGALDFAAAQRLVDVGYEFTARQLDSTGWADRTW